MSAEGERKTQPAGDTNPLTTQFTTGHSPTTIPVYTHQP